MLRFWILALLVISMTVSGCTAPAPTPQIVEVTRLIVQTAEPMPTYTPYPTLTPWPTNTAYATYTPVPMTATPTNTPMPTETPKPELARDGKTPLFPLGPKECFGEYFAKTTAQRQVYAQSLVGQIVRWEAEVYDADANGRVRIYFESGEPMKLFGAYIQVPKDQAMSLSRDQIVTVEGRITKASKEMIVELELAFADVTLEP